MEHRFLDQSIKYTAHRETKYEKVLKCSKQDDLDHKNKKRKQYTRIIL